MIDERGDRAIDKIHTMAMKFQNPSAHGPESVSDQVLRNIAEQGFFGAPGSLAAARLACEELIFARALIAAQTARIAQLDSAAVNVAFAPTV